MDICGYKRCAEHVFNDTLQRLVNCLSFLKKFCSIEASVREVSDVPSVFLDSLLISGPYPNILLLDLVLGSNELIIRLASLLITLFLQNLH